MTWHVRAIGVRECDQFGLRWTLEARTDDLTTTVVADTTRAGQVVDLQSDGYVGTTGDPDLDHQVAEHIADVLAIRATLRSLESIEGHQRGRSDRVRWAA